MAWGISITQEGWQEIHNELHNNWSKQDLINAITDDFYEEMEQEGISIEVIDPRTLNPLDKATIFESVKKTGRVIIADESCLTCGFASEVASLVAEEMFDYLDAPVVRIGSPDTSAPYSPPLEQEYIPGKKEIREAIKKVKK